MSELSTKILIGAGLIGAGYVGYRYLDAKGFFKPVTFIFDIPNNIVKEVTKVAEDAAKVINDVDNAGKTAIKDAADAIVGNSNTGELTKIISDNNAWDVNTSAIDTADWAAELSSTDKNSIKNLIKTKKARSRGL